MDTNAQDAGSIPIADLKTETPIQTDGNTTVATENTPPKPKKQPMPDWAKEKGINPDAIINGEPAWKYGWPKPSIPDHRTVPDKMVKVLDASALQPVEMPPKVMLRAVGKLGFKPDILDKVKLMAFEQVGRYLTMKRVGKILMVRNIHTLEQMDMAKEWVGEILKSTSDKVTVDHKLLATQALASVGEAERKLNEQIVDFAERTEEKRDSERPKNLPPSVAVQVNLAGSHPSPLPASSATSGIATKPQTDKAQD